jgi:hypothetical protein
VSNLHVVKNDGYSLNEVKDAIKDNINNAAQSFITVGYYLKYVGDNRLYLEDGYRSIWEFADGEFGIGKSNASRFMSINDKFSVGGNSTVLEERYKDFSSSKLSEMLTMSDEQLGKLKPTSTIVEIRDLKTNRIDYCEADVDKELERRITKLEALQDDDFIEDLRKRAQIKVDAVALLKENIVSDKQPRYCPHCHMLIEEDE